MALLTSMDRTVNTIILAIAVPMIPYGARVVRASALVIKENQYVEAARAIGCSDLRIMWRHIAPGCIAPYIVVATSLIGVAIITEAALGFLGLSVAPPTATWGEMISKAMNELTFAAHLSVAPGIAITLAVFAFNMIGDALRDLLDPRLRGRAQ
jgi:ABC-type dipeptide/oligopeptide/nickel transport system permease subunit